MERFGNVLDGFKSEYKPFEVPPLNNTQAQKGNNVVKFPAQKSKKDNVSNLKGDIMKNITWRPKENRYMGRKCINNVKIVVYGKTQRECANKLSDRIQEIKASMGLAIQTGTYFFGKCWDKWYAQNKEPFIADTTKDDFKIIRKKLTPLLNLNIRRLNKDAILSFLRTLPENRTKQKVIVQLRSFFKYCFLEQLIKHDPFTTIIFKMKRCKPKPAFTYQQQADILNALEKEKFKPIILFFLVTGLRKNELDFANIENCIDANNVFTTINLKGRERDVRYKKIKLTEEAKMLVMNNLNLFHSYTNRKIADHFKTLLDALNIKGSIVNCRHTFATNCFYLGKDQLVISREMGHSTSQITKDNYIDIDYDLSRDKILKLYNNLYNIY